jgi:hypothetical protein
LPTDLTEPLALTVPVTPWPIILPLLTTTALVELPPQPTLTTAHAPSKLPPPPPPRDVVRRGSSDAGLLRRAGWSGSTDRGACREPDKDFSSLPMLPPALPDWARAASGAIAARAAQSRAIFVRRGMACCITTWFPITGLKI